jgi:hypothetical protein
MPIAVPDFDPMPNVGSQIERAIAAWFLACGIGDRSNNHVSNDYTDRQAPLNDILAHNSKVLVKESGIEAYQVRIESEFPAADQPGDDAAWRWKQINEWIGNVAQALSLMNDGDRDLRATANFITQAGRALAVDETNGANPAAAKIAVDNADMVNFTCQKVIFLGSTRVGKKNGALVFVEQRNYEIHAVPFNSD